MITFEILLPHNVGLRDDRIEILSVHLSVIVSHDCFVTKKKLYCRFSDTIRRGYPASFMLPITVDGRYRLPCIISAERDQPNPLKNAAFNIFSLSSKSQRKKFNITNRGPRSKSITSLFPKSSRSIVYTLPVSHQMVAQNYLSTK